MVLQKGTVMKTIKFNAPCHIGDTVYYVWARKKNNKYTFKTKKSIVLGFLIKNFGQYICVKDKSGTDGTIDIPMRCVSTNKYIIKAAYKNLVSANKKSDPSDTQRSNAFSTRVYGVLSESISVRSEYELGERFINRYKEQDTVTGILVKNENEIASILGEDGGVYSFLELKEE